MLHTLVGVVDLPVLLRVVGCVGFADGTPHVPGQILVVGLDRSHRSGRGHAFGGVDEVVEGVAGGQRQICIIGRSW